MRQLRATGERNRLRIAEPPQQSRRVFLRLKSPPEGRIWGGVRLVNDANGGDNLSHPHFLSWRPIQTEKPDFHRPEFFEQVTFEK